MTLRMQQAVAAAVLIWAAGTILSEAVTQIGAGLCLVLALVNLRRAPLDRDLARYGAATLLFAAWQALSPVVARVTGVVEGWPRGAKFGLIADTVSAAALGVVGQLGLPWTALLWTLGIGWVGNVLFGALQHFASSAIEPPAFVRVNVNRVRENFGEGDTPRFAAGGFMFHRLRLAHAAVALIGPAAAMLTRVQTPARRVAVAALVLALLAAPYLAFARAALVGAGLVVAAVALLGQRAVRRRWVALLAIAAVGVVALSPSWQARVQSGVASLAGGERSVALRTAWAMVRAHPILGVGHGNYQTVALRDFATPELNSRLALDAHNVWLNVWAETGLLGVVLLALSHGALAVALWRRQRAGSVAALGALFSLGAFHLLGLVHYLPFHPSVHLTFALVWGLGLSPGTERPRPASPPNDAG